MKMHTEITLLYKYIYIYIYIHIPKFSTLVRLNIIQLDKLGNFKSENKLKNNDD